MRTPRTQKVLYFSVCVDNAYNVWAARKSTRYRFVTFTDSKAGQPALALVVLVGFKRSVPTALIVS